MNKKIFTLLVGAGILISSLFTVNAQVLPYSQKPSNDITTIGKAYFNDILTADRVDSLLADPAYKNYKYVLSVTGLANPTIDNEVATELARKLGFNPYDSDQAGSSDPDQAAGPRLVNSRDSSIVLFVDSVYGYNIPTSGADAGKLLRTGMARLRLENLAKLDSGAYDFWGYDGVNSSKARISYSKKLEAIRRVSWCLEYSYTPDVYGSNVIYDFTNTATGLKLAIPQFDAASGNWNYTGNYNQAYYNKAIDIADRDKMYHWRFSQTVAPGQPVQDNMPLYVYTANDTVAVLVLNIDSAYMDPRDPQFALSDQTVGGFTVSIKHVSVNDLIVDATGAIRMRGIHTKYVENLLLFTLKKVNTFVMNADDWNAVSQINSTSGSLDSISFSPNATTPTIKSDNIPAFPYVNPFTELGLKAYEVNDSLYHYGYMNFQATKERATGLGTGDQVAGKFLYVDTGFVNDGNNMYLAFNFDFARRDNTLTGLAVKDDIFSTTPSTPYQGIRDVLLWGDSFKPAQSVADFSSKPDWFGYLKYAASNPAATVKINPGFENVYWELDRAIWLIAKYLDANGITWTDPGTGTSGLSLINTDGTLNAVFDFQKDAGPPYIPVQLLYNALLPYFGYANSNEAVTDWDRIINLAYQYSDPSNISLQMGVGNRPQGWGNAEPAVATNRTFGILFNMISVPYLNGNGDGYDVLVHPDYMTYDWSVEIDALRAKFVADSLDFRYAFMKDSIMENQSKFRVVYDPFENEAFINVYQTRVRHANTSDNNNHIWPNWWTNSFGEVLNHFYSIAGGATVDQLMLTRPSDLYTNNMYGGFEWWNTLSLPQMSITEAARNYYDYYNTATPLTSNLADQTKTLTGIAGTWSVLNTWIVEGHGQGNAFLERIAIDSAATMTPAIFNFHSFMEYWEKSRYSPMDKVMISTADTVRLYEDYWTNLNQAALSHMYGWSEDYLGRPFFKDSLFYVDIHTLGGQRIITLDQAVDNNGNNGIDTKISFRFGLMCSHGEGFIPAQPKQAYIPDDLYLIRNEFGEYLCVPIWSIQDSAYWITPKEGENPSLMPCYQWAIINNVGNDPDNGGMFTLVNREFEKVRWDNVFLPDPETNTKSVFLGMQWYFNHTPVNPSFNIVPVILGWKNNIIGRVSVYGEKFIPKHFGPIIAHDYPINQYSFLGLTDKVKGDYLLGYKYVFPDEAFLNVYAFKYLNSLSLNDPRFINWFYETDKNDSTLYARGRNYYDRLYFQLEEMNGENMKYYFNQDPDELGQGMVRLNKNTTATNSPLYDFYNNNKHTAYQNADSLVVERYGFYTLKMTTGTSPVPDQNTLSPEIKDLKPLVRQAYNLLLKDNYRWHPTILGHYMTVGQVDRYMLADKLYARQDYIAPGPGEPNKVEGLFGVPHFYFRNSLFDIEKPGDDYFAMIQRLDTFGILHGFGEYPDPIPPAWLPNYGYQQLESFLTKRFGNVAAGKVLNQIKDNREFGVFNVFVEDATAALYLVVRGDGAERLSTFQLVQDDDPVYRRFHMNEPNEQFGERGDYPDTLEFRLHNDEINLGRHLYENYGNYDGIEPVNINDLSVKDGASGGRDENLDVNLATGLGMYQRDSLDYVISFLGLNWKSEYGDSTKYGLYVDTAYVNRGTGWIKPQYLLAVDPYFPVEVVCNIQTGNIDTIKPQAVLARYLFNTAQYAKEVDRVYSADWSILTPNLGTYRHPATDIWNANGTINTEMPAHEITSWNYNKVEPINPEKTKLTFPYGKPYLWAAKHERIAFAWAIHRADQLIVLKNLPPFYPNEIYKDYDPAYIWDILIAQYGITLDNGTNQMDWDALISDNIVPESGYYEFYYPAGDRTSTVLLTSDDAGYTPVERRQYFRYKHVKDSLPVAGYDRIGIQAVIRLDDNTHKDWVWSMRYIERGSSDFVIESETTERLTRAGAMILPGYGGWMKFENGVPVISRTDAVEVMSDSYGAVFNVKQVTTPGQVVGTEQVAAIADIKIIGGAGTVTILNAAGKSVIITNVLGQTLVSTTLKSDNATLAVPAGVAVVTVETAKAAKVLVK